MTDPLNEVLPEITQLATAKGIQDLKVTKESVHLYRIGQWEMRPGAAEITGKYEGSRVAEKEEFEKKAKELLQAKQMDCEIELKPNLKGMKFPTIPQARAVMTDSAQDLEVAPKPGEVTLFDFWTTWCGPCQDPMAHNQEMLIQHPEWEGKVRIIGMSLDKEIDAPKKRVTDKGWTKVEHYWVSGGWEANICKVFAINGIPFCVLVDKKGEVRLTGHPHSMALEENIPRLIRDEPLQNTEEDEEEKSADSGLKDPAYSQEINKADLVHFVDSHAKELEAVKNPFIASVYRHAAKEGKMQLDGAFVLLRFIWSAKQKAEFEKLKADFGPTFEGKINHRLQELEIKVYTLAFGSKCSKCSITLGTCDQYLCVSCPDPTYFCTSCIDSHKDPKTIADLGHPHGLYFIQKSSGACLDNVRYGNLHACEGELTARNYNAYSCDGCGAGPIMGSHWRCVICADVDICDQCMAAYKNPADPQHAAVIESAKKVGHDMHTHIYGREDFDGMIDFRAAH